MTSLRLLHISDLHFTPHPIPATDVDDKLAVTDLDSLIRVQDRADQILRDLRRVFRARSEWPDAIVVSGDLVDKGGTDRGGDGRGEFDVAVDFLDRLGDLFGLERGRILVVPGNHDIDWTPGLDRLQRYRGYLAAAAGFRSPYERNGQLMPRFERLRSEDGTVVVDIALLASPTFSGEPDPGVRALGAAVSELLAHAGDETARTAERALHGPPLDIAAIGSRQLRAVEEYEPHPRSVRIAVLHHHLLPIGPVEITPFESVVDGGRVLDTLIRSGYDLVLTGHKHERRLSRLQQESGTIDVLTGPSLFLSNPGGTRAGFTMIDVRPAESAQYAVLRSYDTADLRPAGVTELVWPGRVDPEITTLAAGLPRGHQQEHLLPVLADVREVLRWRDGFEFDELDELFQRAWDQLRTELSELADRQMTIRPPLLLKPWESFVRLARRLPATDDAPSIRLASENDLQYWIRSLDSPRSEAARYATPLREFTGTKTRVLVLKDDAFDPAASAGDADRVIRSMIADGFRVEVVRDSLLDRRTLRDFGIVGRFAVWTFSGRRDEVRGLEIDFKDETVRRHEESWRVLDEAAVWDSDSPLPFLDWLHTTR